MNKSAVVEEVLPEGEAVHGDGDDGDDELEIDVLGDEPAPLCTWTKNVDEHRRAFVVRLMADPDLAGHILVSNMDAVCQWLKTGLVPKKKV